MTDVGGARLNRLDPPIDRVEGVASATSTLLGLAGTAGIGASALSLQDKNYKVALQMAIDADLRGRKIHYCPKGVFLFPGKGVPQNRRGLHLLFLQQVGLCLALGEQYCFYIPGSLKNQWPC